MEKLNDDRRHIWKKMAEDYAASCTPHGINYISEQQRLPIERMFWILTVCIAFIFRYHRNHISYCKSIDRSISRYL